MPIATQLGHATSILTALRMADKPPSQSEEVSEEEYKDVLESVETIENYKEELELVRRVDAWFGAMFTISLDTFCRKWFNNHFVKFI